MQNDAGDVPVFGALCFPFMRREWLDDSRARYGLMTVDDPAKPTDGDARLRLGEL